jgi:hypothetical protein
LGHLKTKSFLHRIAFFITFERSVWKIPTGRDNRLAEFIPLCSLQEQLGGRTIRAPASEMLDELSLPCGFFFRLERAKKALVEGLISS